MSTFKELSQLDEKTLAKRLTEIRTELYNVKMQKITAGVEKPHTVKGLRKDVARILTILNSKTREK